MSKIKRPNRRKPVNVFIRTTPEIKDAFKEACDKARTNQNSAGEGALILFTKKWL